jgi:hypothetical protein
MIFYEWHTLPLIDVHVPSIDHNGGWGRGPDVLSVEGATGHFASAAEDVTDMLCLVVLTSTIAGGSGPSTSRGIRHGKDERNTGKPLDPALRGRLIAEARRLGADDDWTPELLHVAATHD